MTFSSHIYVESFSLFLQNLFDIRLVIECSHHQQNLGRRFELHHLPIRRHSKHHGYLLHYQ